MNEQAQEILQPKIKNFASEYVDFFFGIVKEKLDKKVLKTLLDFNPYISKMSLRCGTVKIIIDKSKNYHLSDIYVGSKYLCGKEILDDDAVLRGAVSGARYIVQGLGGSGKTILLKYMFTTIIEKKIDVLPIYIELRRLNAMSTVNLIAFARGLVAGDSVLPENLFFELCKEGRFLFLLDGYDELPEDLRSSVEQQILQLSFNYPKTGFVVTSRFDNRFVSWERFLLLKAQPFDKEAVKSLLRKIDFDKEVRGKFISEVVESNFQSYKTFLEIPLLALMMLSTYAEFAEIPEKLHIFYRYAFQTLYKLHDASKEGFLRSRKVSIGEDELIKLFSTFCLITYIKMEYLFSHESFARGLREASKQSKIAVDVENLISELTESINLIYKDGNNYTFVHRSFQEYFTSLSIISYYSPQLPKFIYKLTEFPGESVISMMADINRDSFEQHFVIPEYAKHKDLIKKIAYNSKTPKDVFYNSNSLFIVMFDFFNEKFRLRYVLIDNNEQAFIYNQIINHVYRDKFAKNVKIPFDEMVKQYNKATDFSFIETAVRKISNFASLYSQNPEIRSPLCSAKIYTNGTVDIELPISNIEGVEVLRERLTISPASINDMLITFHASSSCAQIKNSCIFTYRRVEQISKEHLDTNSILEDIFSSQIDT